MTKVFDKFPLELAIGLTLTAAWVTFSAFYLIDGTVFVSQQGVVDLIAVAVVLSGVFAPLACIWLGVVMASQRRASAKR